MRTFLLSLAAAILLAMTSTAALADDWTVTRLRGPVEQLVGGEWQPLARGDVVPDERSIFTRSAGYATLVRGNEAIELGPNTKIEIYDQGGRKPFTTILQHAGTLTVEAEVRNVQHFAVKTAYLAAVVKGTRFTVTARSTGGAVEVLRGQVSVEDQTTSESVLILAGQKAKVAKSGGISISGKPKAAVAKSAATSMSRNSAATTSDVAPGTASGPTGGDARDEKGGKATKTTARSEDKATKSTVKAADNATGPADNNPVEKVVDTTASTVDTVVGTTTSTVATVVGKTTQTVVKVVDKTTDTVVTVVDKTTGTVDKVTNTTVVSTTVNTVTDTLGKTTKGLTGLLGKKKKK